MKASTIVAAGIVCDGRGVAREQFTVFDETSGLHQFASPKRANHVALENKWGRKRVLLRCPASPNARASPQPHSPYCTVPLHSIQLRPTPS